MYVHERCTLLQLFECAELTRFGVRYSSENNLSSRYNDTELVSRSAVVLMLYLAAVCTTVIISSLRLLPLVFAIVHILVTFLAGFRRKIAFRFG